MGRPKLKLPPVPEPVPLPKVMETPEQAMLKVRRRKGLERTLITGGLTPARATVLG